MKRRAFIAAACALAAPTLARAQAPVQPGVPSARQPRQITAENALEEDFLAAFANPAARTTFRISLLRSLVALPLANSAPDSPPREFPIGADRTACFLYTSPSRLSSVLGPAAPRALMTGREALTRLRGKFVALNYGLAPMLTLEPADIDSVLQIGAG